MDVVFVKVDSAAGTLPDGTPYALAKGQHYPADDPVVRTYPDLFTRDPRYGLQWTGTPPPEMADPPVEQATSAPGERRAAVRRG